MSDMLRELYQEMILDHGRHPRNQRFLADATHVEEGFNPLCGDRVKLFVREQEGVVEEIAFEGNGCAISMASASLLTDCLKGKSRDDIQKHFNAFHELVTGSEPKTDLGKLAILAGVRAFPARVKCATLAWHTLMAALSGAKKSVGTEEPPT